ncbi:hypothetical protein [Parasedimentitalea psychrophila]|uniref:Uncharacterized protein n=1 Tax=Parasedimentitalea psychrophila TaxID=2997337 RepID=A0A9Y2P4G3_9RHOB|nr:hypothetical protein [Parasedimentitalea psychrophila]WIY26942.1 hypothetical protein QPJ95_08530 [Parasedimentitalea psychrophila]
MKIRRDRAATPRIEHLALQVSSLQGPCVGCQNCTGLCMALIDALTLPDIILNKAIKTQ